MRQSNSLSHQKEQGTVALRRRTGIHRAADGGTLQTRCVFLFARAVSALCAGYLGLSITLHASRALSIGDSCSERRLQDCRGQSLRRSHNRRQDRFLSSLEKNQVQLSGVTGAAFFGQLLEKARESYFADPLYSGNRGIVSWKWIGFAGARADFTDWIDQAGKKYPYGRSPSAVRETDG